MLSISQTIGRNGKNNAADIKKVETLLGRMGHLDLNKTSGPTGFFGTRLEEAIKSFQKDNGLKADGHLETKGETISAIRHVDSVKRKAPNKKDGKSRRNSPSPYKTEDKMNTKVKVPGTRDQNEITGDQWERWLRSREWKI